MDRITNNPNYELYPYGDLPQAKEKEEDKTTTEPSAYKAIKDKNPRYVPYRNKLRYFGKIYDQESEEDGVRGYFVSPTLMLYLLGSNNGGRAK